MASENKKLKLNVIESKNVRNLQIKSSDMIDKGVKAKLILYPNKIIQKTPSDKFNFETVHNSSAKKNKLEEKKKIETINNKYFETTLPKIISVRAVKPPECTISQYIMPECIMPEFTMPDLCSSQDMTNQNKNIYLESSKKVFKSVKNASLGSYNASFVIAKHGRPYCDGGRIKELWLKHSYIFDGLEHKEEIIKRIKDMPLNSSTVRRRIIDMANNIVLQQNVDINASDFISLCLTENTPHLKNPPRLTIIARYCNACCVKEELISSISLAKPTKGIVICNAVINALNERAIDLSKIVSVTTDGSLNMTGEDGFVSLFTEHVGHSILDINTIIHHQALCEKTGLTLVEDITSVVKNVIKFLSVHGLDEKNFVDLWNEINTGINPVLPVFCNVLYQNHGALLQIFIKSIEDIKVFLKNKGVLGKFKKLMNVKWLSKLMFYTDLCSHFNEFNIQQQNVNKSIIPMFELISEFVKKLKILDWDVVSKNFQYFTNTKTFLADNNKLNKTELMQEFSAHIQSITYELSLRILQFRKLEETFKFTVHPDEISYDMLNLQDFEWLGLNDMEMQLIEFQCSSMWTQKFVDLRSKCEKNECNQYSNIPGDLNTDNEITKTWKSIPEVYGCLKKLAAVILSIFSSTYACESVKSDMGLILCSNRSSLSHESIWSSMLLRATKYIPDKVRTGKKRKS